MPDNGEKKGKGLKGLFAKIGRFFRDMKGEVKKVVWPTKKQVINNTAVVLVMVIAAAIFIGGLDWVLSQLLALLLKSA